MKPQFGDWLENVMAGDGNPHKRGRFVRVVRVPRGRINAGLWWEITDGRGDFWQSNPEHCTAVRAPEQLLDEAREGPRLDRLSWEGGYIAACSDRASGLFPGNNAAVKQFAECSWKHTGADRAASPNPMDGEGR